MDLFDDSGSDEDDSCTAPTLPPRASQHPYFSQMRLWEADDESASPGRDGASQPTADLVPVLKLLSADIDTRALPACATLRSSKLPYGREVSRVLRAACTACAAGQLGEAAGRAVECANLCSLQLEEGNWDHDAWQIAQLFCVGFQLAAVLSKTSGVESAPEPSLFAPAQERPGQERAAQQDERAPPRPPAAAAGGAQPDDSRSNANSSTCAAVSTDVGRLTMLLYIQVRRLPMLTLYQATAN